MRRFRRGSDPGARAVETAAAGRHLIGMNSARTALACALAVVFMSACASNSNPTKPTPLNSGGGPEPAPAPPPSSVAPVSATARYRVTFDATWSRLTHPTDYPSSAHFSPLIGGTHDSRVTFWQEGRASTAGIRAMAEGGRTTPLDQEVNAAITAGTAQRLLRGDALNTLPGAVTLEFEVSQSHPLVTLVTMIAPSPDWFVGVAGVPLFADGQWVNERTVPLEPWDAGTDSGATFTSADVMTAPPQPISRIVSAPLSPGGRVTPLGTFRFQRIDEAL